ncbi:MAG: hypothetical protein PVJ80_15210 [Gemmatimonadota bacterium]|jgi:hypothetical protein
MRDEHEARRAPAAEVTRTSTLPARLSAVTAGIAVLVSAVPTSAQWTTEVTVTEPAGIRRTAFPTSARFEIPAGRVEHGDQMRLSSGQEEVPSQVTAWSFWPDGSIREVDVDFNVSIGPSEQRSFEIHYGPDVTTEASARRGLEVDEDERTIDVGRIRLNKGGYTLLASVDYRDELIAPGRNGLTVVERSGIRRDPREIRWSSVEVVKPGPLRVLARYRGALTLSGGSTAEITLDVEMPNSKSWLAMSVSVSDPDAKIGDLGFETPLQLGTQPWTWDFATPNRTYGAFRDPTGSATFERTLGADGDAGWTVRAGPAGAEEPYEMGTITGAGSSTWAHFVGPDEAVAFAVDERTGAPGTISVWLTGTGQTTVTFRSSEPATEHDLTVYEHYVATPVPIGAATSPASILAPLHVAVD